MASAEFPDLTGGKVALEFQWSAAAHAADYVLYSDLAPNGSFSTQEGTTTFTNITIPTPPDDLVFYLVAGRNPTCGVGPLR